MHKNDGDVVVSAIYGLNETPSFAFVEMSMMLLKLGILTKMTIYHTMVNNMEVK